METISKIDLDTIIKLSESVPLSKMNKTQVTFEVFYGKGIKDDYYTKFGENLIEKINKNKKFDWIKRIDYDWVLKNEHPLANFSPFYRKEKQKTSENPKYTLADLFCGAGGMSLGFVQEGFEISFANDIDDSCIKTYIHNHPFIPHKHVVKGDIDDVIENITDLTRFKDIDIVIGGPPCQGFSMANRQRIKDDPRNKLYKYFIEAVKKLQPKVFVMENVKGMLNVANQVVEDFMEIGYFTSFMVLNAKDYGVPQNRERIFFIGTKIAGDSDVLFENILKQQKSKNRFLLKDALFELPEVKASTTRNATNVYDKSGGLILPKKSDNSNPYLDLINDNKKTYVVLNGKARYNNDRDIEIYRRLKQGEDSTSERIADIMPYSSRNHIFKDKYFKLVNDDFCKTITAHMQFDCNMYIHPNQARGLTPREAARIQSYPDSYLFLGPYTKTYMQIGNSVPPLLGRALAIEIKKYLKE